jgi:membrane protein DedA with SNARE-associated domain
MIFRAAAVWVAVLVLASLNGGAREAWLIPRFGDQVGRALSTVILCGLVFLVTWLTIGWIRPASASEALKVGALWAVLTLAFEFLAGHYLFGKPWTVLWEDYDVRRGRIWIAVLVMVLIAPIWTARLKGLLPRAPL